MLNKNPITVGIDASNARSGGGVTYLVQLLEHTDPYLLGLKKVIIWGNMHTLAQIPDNSWIEKKNTSLLEKNLFPRLVWQQFILPKELKVNGCDILFSPGGNLPVYCSIPTVTMSRNMLPFEDREMRRYGYLDYMRYKLKILKLAQSRSFRKASGVIFLTNHAFETISKRIPMGNTKTKVIPHGLSKRFFWPPENRKQREYTWVNPFNFLYVSTVDLYKHQWNVARAIHTLRKEGFPVSLTLIGSAYKPALKKLQKTLNEIDPNEEYIQYLGKTDFNSLDSYYKNADGFIFASTCENMPNILLEAMASSLPICSSFYQPMTDIIGQHGLFFDSEDPKLITEQAMKIRTDQNLRNSLSEAAYNNALQYSWKRCSDETWNFISKIRQQELLS